MDESIIPSAPLPSKGVLGITIRHEPGQGYHVIASRPLAAASCVLQEAPHALGCCPERTLTRHCRRCLRLLPPTGKDKGITCTDCGAAHWCSSHSCASDLRTHLACGECVLYGEHDLCDALSTWCREASLTLRCLALPPISPPLETHTEHILSALADSKGATWVQRLLDLLCVLSQHQAPNDAQALLSTPPQGSWCTCQSCWRCNVQHALCQVLVNAVEVQAPPMQPSAEEELLPPVALYPTFSRLNHSCRPNAAYRNRPQSPLVEVRLLRPVCQGEQVVISYLDALRPVGLRRQELMNKYAFTCMCERCTAAEGKGAVVDGQVPQTKQQQEEAADQQQCKLGEQKQQCRQGQGQGHAQSTAAIQRRPSDWFLGHASGATSQSQHSIPTVIREQLECQPMPVIASVDVHADDVAMAGGNGEGKGNMRQQADVIVDDVAALLVDLQHMMALAQPSEAWKQGLPRLLQAVQISLHPWHHRSLEAFTILGTCAAAAARCAMLGNDVKHDEVHATDQDMAITGQHDTGARLRWWARAARCRLIVCSALDHLVSQGETGVVEHAGTCHAALAESLCHVVMEGMRQGTWAHGDLAPHDAMGNTEASRHQLWDVLCIAELAMDAKEQGQWGMGASAQWISCSTQDTLVNLVSTNAQDLSSSVLLQHACAISIGRACAFLGLVNGPTDSAVDLVKYMPFSIGMRYDIAEQVVRCSTMCT